jgi:hypothetical protein
MTKKLLLKRILCVELMLIMLAIIVACISYLIPGTNINLLGTFMAIGIATFIFDILLLFIMFVLAPFSTWFMKLNFWNDTESIKR